MLRAMSDKWRKFIGIMAMVFFSILYFWIIVSVAIVRLQDTSTAVQLVFYFLVSAVWFVVCALIIWWMRPRHAVEPKSSA